MDVLDRLPGVGAGIEDNPVTGIGEALGDRNLCGVGDEFGQQAPLRCAERGQVRVVVARNDEHVDGSLRVNVTEGNRAGIRRDYRRGYLPSRYTAEQAISHVAILSSGPPSGAQTYKVAMLRTLGAPPLWCNGLASYWLPSLRDSVMRGSSGKTGWGVGGMEADWKSGLATRCRTARE